MNFYTYDDGIAATVLLTAISLCYKPKDKRLSTDELISRKFAPSRRLARDILAKLIKDDLVEFHVCSKTSRKVVFIINPKLHPRGLADALSYLPMNARATSSNPACNLAWLRSNVLAGECVEYVLYLAKKEHVRVLGGDPYDLRLKILLVDNELGQVFMLLWRSIKFLSSSGTATFSFCQITEQAYNFNIKYRVNAKTLNSFSAPIDMEKSVLGNLLIHDLFGINFKAVT